MQFGVGEKVIIKEMRRSTNEEAEEETGNKAKNGAYCNGIKEKKDMNKRRVKGKLKQYYFESE